MKKLLNALIILLILAATLTAITACDEKPMPQVFTITYTVGEGGTIDGEANQTVAKGGDGKAISAMPDDGYIFSHWSDGDTSPARTDKNIQKTLRLRQYLQK